MLTEGRANRKPSIQNHPPELDLFCNWCGEPRLDEYPSVRFCSRECEKRGEADTQEGKKDNNNWFIAIFILIILPAAFTYGGAWVGVPVFIIGVIVLGWSDRHKGPFPTK